MNKIRELYRIPHEKYRRVITNYIVITLPSIKLQGKSAWVTFCIRRASLSPNCRKSCKHFSLFTYTAKNIRIRIFRHISCKRKHTKCTAAFCMHYSLGDSLPIKMCHFFKQMGIAHNCILIFISGYAVLVIIHSATRSSRKTFIFVIHIPSYKIL